MQRTHNAQRLRAALWHSDHRDFPVSLRTATRTIIGKLYTSRFFDLHVECNGDRPFVYMQRVAVDASKVRTWPFVLGDLWRRDGNIATADTNRYSSVLLNSFQAFYNVITIRVLEATTSPLLVHMTALTLGRRIRGIY